jgi:cell division protein FtsX
MRSRGGTFRGLLVGALLVGSAGANGQADPSYRRIAAEAAGASWSADLARLAALNCRLAGSAGERASLELAEARFRRLGLHNVRREPFRVTVPDPDAVGRLSGASWRADAFPLWPNQVRTSTCDVEGPLLYGRSGSLADLSFLPLAGSIVLLEFDSGENWKNVFRMGAQAVVFLETQEAKRLEAEAKFSSVPLAAPRFYLRTRDAGPVLQAAFRRERVRLSCRQNWVVRDTWNVLADLPGTDRRLQRQGIVVAAPADAMSVVPGLAPGASNAASLAAMLELARLAARNPGERPMTFVAVAATGLGLQGWREYAERRLVEGGEHLLHLTLDLNDGGESLGAFSRGWYFEYRNESTDAVRPLARALRRLADAAAPALGLREGRQVLLDAVNESDGVAWRNALYARFALGCEPLTMAHLNALTLATAENARERTDTPHDSLERLREERLERQTRALACLLWRLARTGDVTLDEDAARTLRRPSRRSLVGGFATVEGRVVRFDPNESFLADLPVKNSLAVLLHTQKTLSGVRGPIVQATGDEATYRFLGLPPSSAYFHLDQRVTELAAYALDPATGAIVAARTEGLLGYGYESAIHLTSTYRSLPIVVFECDSLDLYGLADPQELTPLWTAQVLDPEGDAQPRHYGLSLPAYHPNLPSEQESQAVLFLEPEASFKLLMGTRPGEWRLLLTGPEQKGYRASELPTVLSELPLLAARDLLALNAARLETYARYRILHPQLNDLQARARQELELAERATARGDWPAADRAARASWAHALRAYPFIQGAVNDVVAGVLFYLLLLIPFSYFVERLLFASRKLHVQLLISLSVFAVSFGLLSAIHPAFEIVSSPSMIFLAFVMGALSLFVGGLIVGKFEDTMQDARARRLGLRKLDVSRMGVAFAAFHLGIANMRRRPARTLLTTLTLVVMTFIVLSFTSIVPGVTLSESPAGHRATYPGILVRTPDLEPLHSEAERALRAEFEPGAAVARRIWHYGAETSPQAALRLSRGEASVAVRALAGFESAEARITRPQRALLEGGRWFEPDDRDALILPRSVADRLGIAPADVGKASVWLGGRERKVLGILDEARLQETLDLDGEPILPADFALSERYQTESQSSTEAFRKFLRLDPGSVVLAPLELVESVGGQLRSVAVRFSESSQTRPALESLMPRLRMNLYAAVAEGDGLHVRQFSLLQGSRGAGFGLILVPMLLAAAFVLNTMIASVYERKAEIGIFSSIGLAPNHIAVLFLAESAAFGVLGAVAGYFLAQAVARVVIETGLTPGLYLNFSASSAVFAAGIVLAVVLLSALYPARIAARLAAPAYEDDVTSEPEGDLWEVRLPFRVEPHEAEPLREHFVAWLQGHESYAIGDLVTADTRLIESEEGTRLESVAWLAPFDMGVSQRVCLEAAPLGDGAILEMRLTLERLSGEPRNWQTANRRFLAAIRREFLAWRTKAAAAA